MSGWGVGNFENDPAQEFLVKLMQVSLIDEVERCFTEDHLQRSGFLETCGEYRIIPAIDIYVTLSEHYDIAPLIEPELAHQWREKYLTAYDRLAHYIFGSSAIKERRFVINSTFDKLDDYLKKWDD